MKDKKSFLKLLLIESAIILTIVAGYFFNDIKSFFMDSRINCVESNCSLNQTECSQLLLDGSNLTINMKPKEIWPLQKVKFVANSANTTSIKLVISGLNMDMGVHEFIMDKKSDSLFETELFLPSCSINMHWQMNVVMQKQDDTLGATFKFWSKN